MIRTTGLGQRIEGATVLDGVDLRIEAGEIYGLLGPLDSGRTALLKLLATLEPTTVRSIMVGSATVGGHDVQREPEAVRRCIGYMPVVLGAFDDMHVEEYLNFFARAGKVEPEGGTARIEQLLDLADLQAHRDEYVDTLDREKKQRLGLAKALMHDPPVVLLDCPAAGLGMAARRRMRELIRRVHQLGKTILLGTNILSDLIGIEGRVGIMEGARLVGEGPAATLLPKLLPGRAFEVKLRGDAARARDLLQAHEGVEQVEACEDRLIFSTLELLDDPEPILRGLSERECLVEAYREREVDLRVVQGLLPASDDSG